MNSLLTSLSAHRAFIVYRASDKCPVDTEGRAMDAQQRGNWMLPHEAEAWAALLGPGHGVGIVLHPELKIFCVDIDGALVDGQWSPLAQAFLTRFAGCYVEVSMSGRGLHVFGRYTGEPPAHKTKNISLKIELYDRARYIALTGTNAVGDVDTDATAQLHQFAADYFVRSDDDDHTAGEWTNRPHPDWQGDTDDTVLLEKMRKSKSNAARFGNALTFEDLWIANAETLGRYFPPNNTSKAPYDESSADLALANHLAFWTGNDCERMQNFMVASALNRDKWEQRESYLRDTILKACARQKTFAGGGRNKPVALPAPVAPPPPWEALQPPQGEPRPQLVDGLTATVTGLAPGAPQIPATVQHAPPNVAKGTLLGCDGQVALFDGCTYVQDVHQIMLPDGVALDQKRFDEVQFNGGRVFMYRPDGQKPTESAWEAFTMSGVYEPTRVRGMYFDPRETPGNIKLRDGLRWINSWKPIDIRAIPGDVTPFLRHLSLLFPLGLAGVAQLPEVHGAAEGREVHVVAVPSGRARQWQIIHQRHHDLLHWPAIHTEPHSEEYRQQFQRAAVRLPLRGARRREDSRRLRHNVGNHQADDHARHATNRAQRGGQSNP